MSTPFDLKILTPEGTAFNGKANSFQTVTQLGAIGIYANMVPTVALIQPCISKVEEDGKFTEYVIVGGLLNVKPEGTSVFSDYCVEKSKVDVAAIKNQISDLDSQIRGAKSDSAKISFETKKKLLEQIVDIVAK